MGSKKASLSCLLITVLIQTVVVSCQNTTVSTSSSDALTSSTTDVTSSSNGTFPTEEKSSTPPEMRVATTVTTMTSSPSAATVAVATSSASSIVEQATSESTTDHPTQPGDHGDAHSTHTHPKETDTHSNKTGRATMGYPYEPDVDALTDEEQQADPDWVVSIVVVFALMGGMIVFVVFFVIQDRARTRERNLSEKKRPGIGGDHGFVPLKEVKTDEEPAQLTKVEKRESLRNSYYGNPEDAVPLLELHISGDGHPVLNSHDETKDTQDDPNSNSVKHAKPLLDVYGDNSKKSQEKLNSPRFI